MRVSYSEKLMEVKDVVRIAKDYVIDLFENEGVHDVGLEEIDFDGHGCWEITIGFSRQWDQGVGSVLRGQDSRTYKVLRITNGNGEVLSIKDRISSGLS